MSKVIERTDLQKQNVNTLSVAEQFQQSALQLINELIDISSSAFYWLDLEIGNKCTALSNLDADIEKTYHKEFRSLDPLNPRKFDHTNDRVVTIDSQMPFSLLRQTIYYQEFMQPSNHRYVADMFFRYEGEVIAVLTCLRDESGVQFSEKELSLLRILQPFLETTLNTVYLPKLIEERQTLQGKYDLTKRELDVLELIISGDSNKAIALKLNLGLATVKTHSLHIYRKTGFSCRNELLSNIIADLKEGH